MSYMLFEEYWSELSSANYRRIDDILTATSFTYIKHESTSYPSPWGILTDISDELDKRFLS